MANSAQAYPRGCVIFSKNFAYTYNQGINSKAGKATRKSFPRIRIEWSTYKTEPVLLNPLFNFLSRSVPQQLGCLPVNLQRKKKRKSKKTFFLNKNIQNGRFFNI